MLLWREILEGKKMYQPWNEQELASASPGDLNNSLIPIAYNYWIRIDATLTNNLYWHSLLMELIKDFPRHQICKRAIPQKIVRLSKEHVLDQIYLSYYED